MSMICSTAAARRMILTVAGVLLLTGWAGAIQPERWVHSTEADFEAGETDGVVVTNLGDLKLATATQDLAELPEDVALINDVEIIGEATYLAVGPAARLLRVIDGQVEEVAALEDNQVFSLSQIDGQLLVGTSGEVPGVWALVDDQLVAICEWPERQYVWDLLPMGRDLMVATGPEGEVVRIVDAAGYVAATVEGNPAEPPAVGVVLDAAQANVLCLAAGPDGAVYAGTDTDGLIYRLRGDEVYVVYDADEPEIGALLVSADGTLYAGTADAEQAKPGRLEAASEAESGRPELDAAAPDAPDTPDAPDMPDAPELPIEPEPQPLQAGDAPSTGEPADESTAGDAAPADNGSPSSPADAETDAEAAGSDPAAAATADASAPELEPTPEQLDAVREEIRKRLLEARKSGAMAGGTGGDSARPTRNATAAAAGDKSGNAVYRVDDQGFVSEVFRDSVMILTLAERADGKILVGTGNDGQLYLIDPAAGETSVLNDLESQQLLALHVRDDGVLAAGSNPAALTLLQGEPAETGTYTSAVLDASQISLWGTGRVTVAAGSDGSSVTLQTRSGNVADPEIAGWSEWTDAEPTSDDQGDMQSLQPREMKVASPPARFLQYRLTLDVGDASTATDFAVGRVELAYVTPNLRPSITSLSAKYPDFAGVDKPASPAMTIEWEATDDNGDRLIYRLDYKPLGSEVWLPLVDDLTDTSYEWDTRLVPDGRYHLRVTASDRLDNPGDMAMTAGRVTDPVLVDNSPPLAEVARGDEFVSTVNVEVQGNQVKLTGTARDRWTPIHSVAYRLADATEYTPVLPDDLIYDSTTESWSATVSDLTSGPHSVTVRMVDSRGNAVYTSKLFDVP